ncbi:MAG: hypothetical protein RIT02_361, partial [Planctomycetota bacterium]
RLAQFLGGGLQVERMAAVVDGTLYRERQQGSGSRLASDMP